jgi:hypothetical protein
MATTSGTYPWSCVTQIFHSHCGDCNTFEVMTSTYPWLNGFFVSINPKYQLSYAICGVTVCMSVCCAVDRGVYLICGVTVCMPVWCAVDRGVYIVCGVKVCMPAWCPVDREFLYCLPRVQ